MMDEIMSKNSSNELVCTKSIHIINTYWYQDCNKKFAMSARKSDKSSTL